MRALKYDIKFSGNDTGMQHELQIYPRKTRLVSKHEMSHGSLMRLIVETTSQQFDISVRCLVKSSANVPIRE